MSVHIPRFFACFYPYFVALIRRTSQNVHRIKIFVFYLRARFTFFL